MLGYISVVKFVTKPGHSEDFVEICKQNEFRKINGLIEATLIQTDENNLPGFPSLTTSPSLLTPKIPLSPI